MAGEQSCGTFTRVPGETDDLRARARARVESVDLLESVATPSLHNAWLARQAGGMSGQYQRARVRIAFPVANVGANLATLAATVGGNLYDLGEVTGLRLESLELPANYRAQFAMPQVGIAGPRQPTGVATGPLVGTIIKPNVGLSPEQTAHLVAQLCAAGVAFIKAAAVCANPAHAPLAQRVAAVMAVVRAHRERTGRQVIKAPA
ncbi:hypothetical protein G6F31_016039 [Rhizopus arrhizus]|nr:hypothetical protein G6F31_016039 [Rhizopus arrhizus]